MDSGPANATRCGRGMADAVALVLRVGDEFAVVAKAAAAAGASAEGVAEAVAAAAEALAAVARPARPLGKVATDEFDMMVYEKGGKDEKEFGPVSLVSGCFGAGFTQNFLLAQDG